MTLTTNSRHTQRKVLSTHIKISTYFSDKIVMSASVIACLRGYHLQNIREINVLALLEAAFYYYSTNGAGGFQLVGHEPPAAPELRAGSPVVTKLSMETLPTIYYYVW